MNAQNCVSYEFKFEKWCETEGTFNSFNSATLAGKLNLNKYPDSLFVEYIMDDGCLLSLKIDRNIESDLPLMALNRSSNCDKIYPEIVSKILRVFNLKLENLEVNRTLSNSGLSIDETYKYFKLGEYKPKEFSKGSEISGAIKIEDHEILSISAKFMNHLPTSAIDLFEGGIIKINKIKANR